MTSPDGLSVPVGGVSVRAELVVLHGRALTIKSWDFAC